MKSIILKPWELKAAIEGTLTCIVRPWKPQPDPLSFTKLLPSRYPWIGDIYPWYFSGTWRLCRRVSGPKEGIDFSEFTSIENWKTPFSPGETAFVKETWAYNLCGKIEYKADIHSEYWHDFHFESILKMKQEQSRFTITWTEVKAVQAKDLTIEELELIGVPSYVFWSDQMKWLYDNYKCDKLTWLWLYKVEVKNV